MTDVGEEALDLLKVPEVAARLSVSKSTVWRLVYSGELESVKRGRSRRITPEAVTAYKDELIAQSRAARAASVPA
jgi:excisionase family DNA binding protein